MTPLFCFPQLSVICFTSFYRAPVFFGGGESRNVHLQTFWIPVLINTVNDDVHESFSSDISRMIKFLRFLCIVFPLG